MLIILIDIKQVFYLLSYYAERYADCYVDDIMTERPKHIPKIKRFGPWKTMVVTSTGFIILILKKKSIKKYSVETQLRTVT